MSLVGTGVGHHIPFECGTPFTAVTLQGEELEVGFSLIYRLESPLEAYISREEIFVALQQEVYRCGVELRNSSYHWTSHAAHGEIGFIEILHETSGDLDLFLLFGKQSRFSFVGSNRVGSNCCCGVGQSRALGHRIFRRTAVHLIEESAQLIHVVGLPELQVGTSLQKVTYTLRLGDPGELHQDALGTVEALDVGSNHTKTVDTGCQYIKGVVGNA